MQLEGYCRGNVAMVWCRYNVCSEKGGRGGTVKGTGREQDSKWF